MLGWVTVGNSETRVAKGLERFHGSSDGLGDVSADMVPCMCRLVMSSTRRRWPKSTMRP